MLALYGHPFSSYTWKALIPLYANDTEFEFREITRSIGKRRIRPAGASGGKFPVLTDGDVTVVEATAIIEYLAVHHPGPAPLIPVEPSHAAAARMLDRVFDNYVMGNMQRVVAAYFVDKDNPGAGGCATSRTRRKSKPARRGCGGPMPGWSTGWRPTCCRRTSAWSTCAAAPSLFYADWVERDPGGLPAPRRLARRAAGPARRQPLRRGGPALSRLFPARRARSRLKERAMSDQRTCDHPPYRRPARRGVGRAWPIGIEEWWCPKPWRAEFDQSGAPRRRGKRD